MISTTLKIGNENDYKAIFLAYNDDNELIYNNEISLWKERENHQMNITRRRNDVFIQPMAWNKPINIEIPYAMFMNYIKFLVKLKINVEVANIVMTRSFSMNDNLLQSLIYGKNISEIKQMNFIYESTAALHYYHMNSIKLYASSYDMIPNNSNILCINLHQSDIEFDVLHVTSFSPMKLEYQRYDDSIISETYFSIEKIQQSVWEYVVNEIKINGYTLRHEETLKNYILKNIHNYLGTKINYIIPNEIDSKNYIPDSITIEPNEIQKQIENSYLQKLKSDIQKSTKGKSIKKVFLIGSFHKHQVITNILENALSQCGINKKSITVIDEYELSKGACCKANDISMNLMDNKTNQFRTEDKRFDLDNQKITLCGNQMKSTK